ncbi:hypothetical protein GGP41_005702 [Bipolaris sorokiniana]|uniref:Uncharacterized protein n=1 Tax=Cochliobolus sativus TaxID=45130 RepID=A0A8H6DUE7_COCSA|nr:hypothetical protein GGP41_005702 [Bipolaris sorokiniana]
MNSQMDIEKLNHGQKHPDISRSHRGHQRIQQPLTTYTLIQIDPVTREGHTKIYSWMVSLGRPQTPTVLARGLHNWIGDPKL